MVCVIAIIGYTGISLLMIVLTILGHRDDELMREDSPPGES